MERVPICVFADDPVSQAGMMSSFRPRPEVLVVEPEDERAVVAVVVTDTVDERTLQTLRSLQRRRCRALLVVRAIDDAALGGAVEAGLGGLVRRADATPERLAQAVCSVAKGDGTVPSPLATEQTACVSRSGVASARRSSPASPASTAAASAASSIARTTSSARH